MRMWHTNQLRNWQLENLLSLTFGQLFWQVLVGKLMLLNCSPDLQGKVAAMEESGLQGVEQLREELQKEKKVLELQGEVVNGLANGAIPACNAKISGMNCIKMGLPGKLILTKRKGLLEVLFS